MARKLEPTISRKGKRIRQVQRDRWPAMVLEQVNAHEKLTVRLFDKQGHALRRAGRKLSHLLRCHQSQKERPIHWQLLRNLYRISQHFPGRTIHVYSGYRAKSVAKLATSYHVKGRAVDFSVAGISNRVLRDYIRRTFTSYGLGYYPQAPFVHLDSREGRAFWVDFSGRGEDPQYAENPLEVIAQERAAAKMHASEPPQNAAPAPEEGQETKPEEDQGEAAAPVSNVRGAP